MPAQTPEIAAEWVPRAALRPWVDNPRKNDPAVARVAESIKRFGFAAPIVARRADGQIIAGHTRFKAAEQLGLEKVPVRFMDLDPADAKLLALADNRLGEFAEWDDARLLEILGDLRQQNADAAMVAGWSDVDIDAMLKEAGDASLAAAEGKRSLVEEFGVPPFTVLDGRQGYWLDRKRAWLAATGMDSGEGRGENLLMHNEKLLSQNGVKLKNFGTSTFDPVLAEMMCRWFCLPGGAILDPFAGGSVRGIVATHCGFSYTGIDLRAEQIAANRKQAEKIGLAPNWILGDSADQLRKLGGQYDMILSCPPYYDLERYSEDPLDLSNMAPEAFDAKYTGIIADACARLRDDRFACFVVSNVRHKDGGYRDLVGVTVEAFEGAGARYYNEACFLNPLVSLPMRAAAMFGPARKLGRAHQSVLIFFKGNPKHIKELFGKVKVPEFIADSSAGTESSEALESEACGN